MGMEFQLGKVERFWRWTDGGDGPNAAELYMSMVKMMPYVVYFCHSKKIGLLNIFQASSPNSLDSLSWV